MNIIISMASMATRDGKSSRLIFTTIISYKIIFLFGALDLFALFMFPIIHVETVLVAFRSRHVILLKH